MRERIVTMTTRIVEHSLSASVSYVGKAQAGSLVSEAKWQIQKLDESSGTVITWADGDDEFDNIWADRESLSYS